MAEPTLAAALSDLQADVGFYLGYGRGTDFSDTAWTTGQQATITRCVKGGLRNFYHCGHDWTFLKPMVTLTLASGVNFVNLPDDAGGVESDAIHTTSDNSSWNSIPFGSVATLYNLEAADSARTGPPQAWCIEPRTELANTQGQRLKIRVYPTSDQAYTVRTQIWINPSYLTGLLPYAYGGAQHAETILAACKAVAELDLDGKPGEQEENYQKKLVASIAMDSRSAPQNLGMCRDNSDSVYATGRAHDRFNYATFNDVIPS